MATCKGCGADIRFIKTAKGKMHPIDSKSEKRWVQTGSDPDLWGLADTFISHFATCPQADRFRKHKNGI